MNVSPNLMWTAFTVFILFLLFLDLFVFHRKSHTIKLKEALIWSVVWVLIALAFNVGIYFVAGKEKALNFFAGYLLERALSMDNIFVFLLIFNYFRIPGKFQHRILFWGIFGALVIRAIFIFAGVAMIERFHWVVYILGVFLIITGIKMFMEKEPDIEPERNPVIKLFKKFMPVTHDCSSGKFFVMEGGKRVATVLFIALLVVETTDVVFAVDSIPAVLAITTDPFIVYTSNVFAILGLRALYFALAGVMEIFHYLHYGLAFILVFIGFKMLLGDIVAIPIGVALGVIVVVLFLSIVFSLIRLRMGNHSPEKK